MGGFGSGSASSDLLPDLEAAGRGAAVPARASARLARRALPPLLALALALGSCAPEPRIARLGDLPTASGEIIRDCRIGYRTYGSLDAARSNAVLLLPWFQGTSGELASQIGPGKLVDSSRWFVIAVDALGNGVASSPSTSAAQPGASFPRIGIEDMVESQHALLTRVLGIEHLAAIVGVSMGGMQALAWATEHPGFADQVVSVSGSPRSTEQDRRHWSKAVEEVQATPAWRRAVRALARLDPPDAFRQLRIDPADLASQARAIAELDLGARHGGSLEHAGAAVRARTMVVVAARDDVVDPEPARRFAAAAGAALVVLDGRCGHQASRCERGALREAVGTFLREGLRAPLGRTGSDRDRP